MSITSTRVVQIGFSGDVTQEVIVSALDNEVAFGKTDLITLAIGDTVIDVPVITDLVVTGLTIIPPAGNEEIITLKGDPADVGIPLHLTDPTSLALDPTFASLVLTVAAEVSGVRLVWS